MDPSLMAYSLSILLITAALFYYKPTWAQNCRGCSGDDNRTELDKSRRAYCTGNITSWRVCYYEPELDSDDNDSFSMKYAVYSGRNGTDCISQVSNFTLTFNSTLRQPDKENGQCSGNGQLSEGFLSCYKKVLETPFTVRNGDIIGACVSGDQDHHEDSKIVHRLNIVGIVEGQPTADVGQIPWSCHTASMNICTINTANIQATETVPTVTNLTKVETFITVTCSPPAWNRNTGDSPARAQERRALQAIMRSKKFKKVCNLNASDDLSVLDYLRNFTKRAVREREVNLSAPIYLLSSIINRFQCERRRVKPDVTKLLLTVSSSLLDIVQTDKESRLELLEPPLGIAGSTLLQVMDRFAHDHHNISHPIAANLSQNIVFHVEEVKTADRVSPIEDERAKISIPREVLEGATGGTPIRLASFLFGNMTGLLPASLNENDTNQEDRVLRLASPVISASCENCTTSNLSTPIEINFTHLPYDKALLENDINGTSTCVFWDFEDTDLENQESILFTGQWSTEGCNTNFTSESTMCKCDHLTHFAILLSARPLDFSREQTLALQTTGYIGVSVSLVAMAATTFVFTFLKSLRTMRNYIHIQLCVTLGIAQIIFVAGVEPRLGEGSGVSIGCRSVAVLLHYWFLVSFMWMLMEGVVLYVVLVRVFIKFHGRYIAAFTIASYGLPLLYVGALTVPLGFVRTDIYRQYHSYDYGYEQACYLNPDTSFVWSLIAPVILIFLANFGFFIMAIVIMYKHQKRQNIDDKKHKVKHWIKASISLTVVMGITWIIGVLVIEIEELFALAYIFTIFVAFQGVFIFVIFVLFSKQVKENYAKWWKAKVAESGFLSKHFGSKSLTTGTSLSPQNNNIPLPAAHGKTNGVSSRSDSGISSKVFENSGGEQRLEVGSYCDLKSESYFINNNVKESDTGVSDKHSNQANKSSKV